jgi:hypothetical protein
MLIAAVVVVTVLYVLSYAPYIRYRHGASGYPDFSGLPESALALYDFDADWSSGTHRGFAPVERLIDETPLAAPLTLWARVWGCDQTFSELRGNRKWNAAVRRIERNSETR